MNKKGLGGVLIIFFIVMALLIMAFVGSLLTAIANNFMDEVTPTFDNLGVVTGDGSIGDNLSQNAGYITTPGNAIVNSMSWIVGVTYILALIMVIGLAVSFRYTGEKWMLALFFLLVLLALMLSIMISNTYQDFYDAGDSIASELHNQTLTSWLILYSPLITIIVMFISALVMFSGLPGEEVVA